MCRWAEPARRLALAVAALAGVSLAGMPVAAQALDGPAAASPPAPRFGYGVPATAADIAAWDLDVRPDGAGLPEGRGTVAAGQALYDAQCAGCHGTFGESNQYMALAGGVGSLAGPAPVRTTGSKLNFATTLFDYINRAMPFASPKSLAPDEVYALTAYVLHLNDVLPADGVLDRVSLVALRMPNRDGFTTRHGLASVRGRPDTRNVACMRNCGAVPSVTSSMPDFARDSHGNLADQTRTFGPVVGAVTTRTTLAAPGAVASPGGVPPACLGCHGVDQRLVGPSFKDVAARYAADASAGSALAAKIRQGGAGAWGEVPMPPQGQVSDGEAQAIVAWILQQR